MVLIAIWIIAGIPCSILLGRLVYVRVAEWRKGGGRIGQALRRHKQFNEALLHEMAKVMGTELAIPGADQRVYDNYGHPWAPIPELIATLPPPPINYSWEITAALNSYGSPALRLSLLDLRTTEVTDFIERDLVVIRRWRYAEDDTFASFYRRAANGSNTAPAVKLCRKVFYAHLLMPMADWAKAIAVSKAVTEPSALTTNYRLIQGQVA